MKESYVDKKKEGDIMKEKLRRNNKDGGEALDRRELKGIEKEII